MDHQTVTRPAGAVHDEDPAQARGMSWVSDTVKALGSSTNIDTIDPSDYILQIAEEIVSVGLTDEESFYARQGIQWLAALVFGCRRSFFQWLTTKQPMSPNEFSSSATRMFLRSLAAGTDGAEKASYDEFARQIPASADVRDMNRLRNEILQRRSATARGKDDLLAVDSAFQVSGGYHEGAWITMKFLLDHPPNETNIV